MIKFLKHLIITLLNISLILIVISCTKESKKSGSLPAEIALQSAKGLQVGVAMADITPDNPVNVDMAGYDNRKSKSTGVHDPITARCMVINDGKSVVALVSLDFIGLFMKHVEDMKKMIVNETGLKDENIFIHSIHTHSGPEMLRDDTYNGAYRAKINRSVTNCILEAFKTSKKATALISAGHSQVKTINRRYPAKKITNKFTTIEFQDTAHQTISMLLNFGCHPVVLGPDNFKMSADYVFYLRKKVEEEKGGIALFFNSRFGDINPAPLNTTFVYERTGGTFEMAQEMGEQLAQDMLQASLDYDTLPISIKTATKTIEIKMKFSNHTHISILNLGHAQIAMIPGEPLEGFVDKIETLLPGPYAMVFGQTGDAMGYIIPENEWNSCTNVHSETSCHEEQENVCAGISVAGLFENGFKELLNQ
jgi:hypothetical protein